MALAHDLAAAFTPELIKACLVLALISNVGVFSIFAYIGRQTKRLAYSWWTIAWLFHAVALASLIAKDFLGADWTVTMIPAACVGITSLLMFAGNREMAGQPLDRDKIGMLGISIIGLAAIFSAEQVGGLFSGAVFVALSAAAIQTGFLHWHRRKLTASVVLVAGGFWLWSIYGVVTVFVHSPPAALAASQLLSAASLVAIGLGVVVEHEVGSSEQKYRTIMDGTNDSIFVVDLWTLKILDANIAAGRFARRDPMDLIGASFLNLCPDLYKSGDNVLDNRNMFAAVFRPFNEFR